MVSGCFLGKNDISSTRYSQSVISFSSFSSLFLHPHPHSHPLSPPSCSILSMYPAISLEWESWARVYALNERLPERQASSIWLLASGIVQDTNYCFWLCWRSVTLLYDRQLPAARSPLLLQLPFLSCPFYFKQTFLKTCFCRFYLGREHKPKNWVITHIARIYPN